MLEKQQLMQFQNCTGKKRSSSYFFVLNENKYFLYTCINCFSLDHDQKEELIHVIEKLLSDKTTLVVGSAVMAFEEVSVNTCEF